MPRRRVRFRRPDHGWLSTHQVSIDTASVIPNTSGTANSSSAKSAMPASDAALSWPELGSFSLPVSKRSGTGSLPERPLVRAPTVAENRSAGIVVIVAVAEPVARTATELDVVEDRSGQR